MVSQRRNDYNRRRCDSPFCGYCKRFLFWLQQWSRRQEQVEEEEEGSLSSSLWSKNLKNCFPRHDPRIKNDHDGQLNVIRGVVSLSFFIHPSIHPFLLYYYFPSLREKERKRGERPHLKVCSFLCLQPVSKVGNVVIKQ